MTNGLGIGSNPVSRTGSFLGLQTDDTKCFY